MRAPTRAGRDRRPRLCDGSSTTCGEVGYALTQARKDADAFATRIKEAVEAS